MLTALALTLALQTAPVPSYWGALKPGLHPVGFTQLWVTDSTRRLPDGAKYGLGHRPVLLNIWYPARQEGRVPMPYEDYFQGGIRAARAPGLKRYATALIAYQRSTAWRELARSERDSTEPVLASRIEALFRKPAYAQRNLPRATPSGNVVVYTSGAGSSMDDNVVLCEYLASLGYTVVGSPFPAENNASFRTSASDHSRPRDIGRILMELPRQGFPVSHVTAIGHSAGAQALLWFTIDPSIPVDAVISLDTTEDYAMLTDRTWAYYTDDVIRNRREVKLPLMFVAGPEALFELADSLANSRRTLLTVPDLDHNDFISQGILSRQLRAGLPEADSSAEVTAATNYRLLVGYLAGWIAAVRTGQDQPPAISPLVMTAVGPGTIAPVLGPDPLTRAREVRHLFTTASADDFARRVMLARAADPEVASPSVLMMLLVDAVRRGAAERARTSFQALVAQDTTLRRIPERMESRAKLFQRIGAPELAADWRALRAALVK